MTKKSWEKELLSALILTGDEPVEVIFSGGVSKTIRVIPWKLFVKHINSLLAKQDGKSYGQGYKEGYADAEYQVKKEIEKVLAQRVCWNPYCAKDADCQKHRKEQIDTLLSIIIPKEKR